MHTIQTCVIPCWPWTRALTFTPYYRDISHSSGCFHPVACGHVAIRDENDRPGRSREPTGDENDGRPGAQQLTLPQRAALPAPPVTAASARLRARSHHALRQTITSRRRAEMESLVREGGVGGLREHSVEWRDQHRRQHQPRFQLGNCWPPLISSRSRNRKQPVFSSC
jgi:hypothetical protein